MSKKKHYCIDTSCILIILLSTSLVEVGGESVYAILGRDSSVPCFDPNVANSYQEFYVTVTFQSANTMVTVCQYRTRNQQLAAVNAQFVNRVSFESTGSMSITSVSLNDEGIYTCTPSAFGLPNPQPISTNLTVYVTPTVQVRKVTDPLLAGSNEMEAAACTALSGKPPANVNWKTDKHMQFNESNGNVVGSNQGQGVQTVEKILHIRPTKFYNGKSFFCEVIHPAFDEPVNQMVVLNVTFPPEKAVVTVSEDRKSLVCNSVGNPPPTITWITPASTVVGDTVLLINPEDPGRSNDTYTCVASNTIDPSQKTSVTTGFAVSYVEITQQANVGAIIGGVIGGLALLAIIILLVYIFVLRPSQEKDTGPYQYSGTTLLYKDTGSTSRPTIEHANESLNKNRPPSPVGPPPEDKMDHGDMTSSGSESDEGNHDVDVEVNPATNLVDPDRHESAEIGGITSRASVNFQARRKRPSTSPAHRQSRNEGHMQRKEDSPEPLPRQHTRYDTPPGDDYNDDDERYHGYPGEYDDRYQPQYVGYPGGRQPPRRTDSLPQHEPKYTEIDHSAYQGGHRRPQFEEPVEYAQIRHGYSHVV